MSLRVRGGSSTTRGGSSFSEALGLVFEGIILMLSWIYQELQPSALARNRSTTIVVLSHEHTPRGSYSLRKKHLEAAQYPYDGSAPHLENTEVLPIRGVSVDMQAFPTQAGYPRDFLELSRRGVSRPCDRRLVVPIHVYVEDPGAVGI